MGQSFPGGSPFRRADIQRPRFACRLLYVRLFDQPRHGRQHGGSRRQISHCVPATPTASFSGTNTYKLSLPKDIPAALFWSVTVYDSVTGSGLDNGQPFPSLNAMDKPPENTDGSTDIYFGPIRPAMARTGFAPCPTTASSSSSGSMDRRSHSSTRPGSRATL